MFMPCHKLHVGNLVVFQIFVLKTLPPLTLVRGPQWPLGLLTFCLSLFGCTLSTILVHCSSRHRAATVAIAALSVFVVALTFAIVVSDPGIILPSEGRVLDLEMRAPQLVDETLCQECSAVQEDIHTMHCETCDACIQGFDHHCPWTAKCVGEKNKRVFWIWIASVMVYILMAGWLSDA
eukprot:Gregarina_sp_Pseudo_9__185@NODE_1121_length_1861_cov_218_725027_g1048_i0_p3_GENE_NODE_1121_length_1861_cov_218_725027_g1048_i0NODE_1121_length_1861_cov_218_725027_g1048_i0_p3_ORF_typecomplete_len179_score18_31DHHC/PF01529_20/66DHHC/PF01529_20/2_5e19HIF1/PF11413_8/0_37FUSClike/PF12805_7/3ABC2_membrane_2/PF12679_7/3_4DUF1772/PF08592_11/0_71DUF1772/PF08592_11/1e03stn_TNFRSF12A/PF12191_8/1_7e03stn_TNFRSF12A/PF12191_8/9_7_NODE_1121_length_1861_cov_218_725027_g1048_i03539